MPTPTFTGFKQKLNAIFLLNELGPASPYDISYAGSASGYSFGYPQWDLTANASDRSIFKDILTNAKDSGGNYIIQDSNPNTNRTQDVLIAQIYDAAILSGDSSLTTAQKNLVNQALSSSYGQSKIDQEYSLYLDNVISHVQGIIDSVVDSADKTFLNADLPKLFLCDYHNQFDLGSTGPMANYIRGQSTIYGTKSGSMGVDDLLNAYFHTGYAGSAKGLADEMRRFSNVVVTGGGYTPANAEEAKNIFRLATEIFIPKKTTIEANYSTSLNSFASQVLDPAKGILIADLNTSNGLNLDAAAYLSTDIYLDPGRNNSADTIDPNHEATLTGSDRNDIILGEGGNDTLIGGKGNDVLVGGSDGLVIGSDNDVLDGGEGDDKLLGGIGNDVLIGGKDNDYLNGGSGFDIYQYNMGDGNDTIQDSDGNGLIAIADVNGNGNDETALRLAA